MTRGFYPRASAAERLDRHIEYDTNGGCWLWSGQLNVGGYGVVSTLGHRSMAHRVSFERSRGPIPAGLELDHLCRVRCCVNPAHLEPVTTKENVLRGNGPSALNAQKTHCYQGHRLSGSNLKIKYLKGTPRRHCMECNRINNRLYYWKKRRSMDPQP